MAQLTDVMCLISTCVQDIISRLPSKAVADGLTSSQEITSSHFDDDKRIVCTNNSIQSNLCNS